METTNPKSKSVLQAILAVALMAGSGVATGWTIRSLDGILSPASVILSVLGLLFLFVAGAMWTGRLIGLSGCEPRSGRSNGAVFALLLTMSGILLLCFNAGVLPTAWKGFFFSWPMLVFVLGAIGICRFHFSGGFIVALAGGFFLVPGMAAIYPDEPLYDHFITVYWPLLVILPGLFILFHVLFHRNSKTDYSARWHVHGKKRYAVQTEENHDGKINFQSLFGYLEQVILDPVFRGGSLETVFAGISLDLYHTSLPEGETFLYAKTLFGGIEIKIPADWLVEIIASKTVAGGVYDARVIKSAPANPERKLVIMAECIFGGVSIE
ncbi:MAG: cell wall-active antibiotics response protein [Tannerella sp.]|nr:cell wall-active antibiotics response protein [Tannerella sp.]